MLEPDALLAALWKSLSERLARQHDRDVAAMLLPESDGWSK